MEWLVRLHWKQTRFKSWSMQIFFLWIFKTNNRNQFVTQYYHLLEYMGSAFKDLVFIVTPWSTQWRSLKVQWILLTGTKVLLFVNIWFLPKVWNKDSLNCNIISRIFFFVGILNEIYHIEIYICNTKIFQIVKNQNMWKWNKDVSMRI